MSFPESLSWRDDGHWVTLRVEADGLIVAPDRCPNGNHPDSDCYHHAIGGCLVRHFVQTYGLDINLSNAAPKEQMQILWAWDGNPVDIDSDTCYIMFVDDERVSGWLAAEKETTDGGTDESNSD